MKTLNELLVADDVFSAIVAGGKNPGDPGRVHAMLFSYFDDSSDPTRSEYFSVGGLVASEDRWRETGFHLNWALATKDLVEHFRSTDCETRHGQFSNWEVADCNRLMSQLVSIIINSRLGGFAAVVPVQIYRDVFPDAEEYDPYYLAVKSTIIVMAELGRENQYPYGFGGVKCWFEDSDATAGKIFHIYRGLRSVKSWDAAKFLAPNPEFETKRVWQLQAADLVAREAFKHFKNKNEWTRDVRIPVKRLDEQLNFVCWTRETLEYHCCAN